MKKYPKKTLKNFAVKQLFRSLNSLEEDFLRLLSRAEKTDFTLNNFKVHTQVMEFRTDTKITQLSKILSTYPIKTIKLFLRWVYGSKLSTGDTKLYELFSQLNIQNPATKTLKKDLIKLYNSDATKDFTIVCESKAIKVHKFVLQARSDLYRGMFINLDSNITEVKDYSKRSFETLQVFIKFLYHDKLFTNELNKKIMKEMFDAIEYYQLNKNSTLLYYFEKYNQIGI